jgi:uncharacterized membrane protein
MSLDALPAALPDPPLPDGFHGALAHLYRGEMHRMTIWRTRLDATASWAILLTTGMTTFTLGTLGTPHYILLLGLAINCIFMLMEARRYQHLHHSKWRLRLLEHNYFAQLLCPTRELPEPRWRVQLALDLERPHYTIGLFMAARLRLRRNYLMLLYFTTAVWATKLFIHPHSPGSLAELYRRLEMGGLFPSWFVATTASVFLLGATLLAAITPSEETLERWTREKQAELSQPELRLPPAS